MFHPKFLKINIFAGLVVFLVSPSILSGDCPWFRRSLVLGHYCRGGDHWGLIVMVISRSALGVSEPAAGGGCPFHGAWRFGVDNEVLREF